MRAPQGIEIAPAKNFYGFGAPNPSPASMFHEISDFRNLWSTNHWFTHPIETAPRIRLAMRKSKNRSSKLGSFNFSQFQKKKCWYMNVKKLLARQGGNSTNSRYGTTKMKRHINELGLLGTNSIWDHLKFKFSKMHPYFTSRRQTRWTKTSSGRKLSNS